MIRWKRIACHWQNLAHDEVWQRMHDEVTDLLMQAVGPDAERQHWERVIDARNRLHGLVDGKFGPLWQHGRAWFYVFASEEACKEWTNDHAEIGVSWSLLHRQPSLGFSLDKGGDSGGELTFSLRVPRAGVYLSVELPRHWRKRFGLGGYEEREIGVRFHDGTLWFSLWNDPHDCDYRAPFSDPRSRSRQPVLHLTDLIFGKAKHHTEDLERFEGTLNLDAGYPITARRFVSEWRRSRWPLPRRVMRVEIEIPGGIPIPGKGENGWDCEDDAIYGRTAPATTIEEAARKLVADVEQTRRKRGGRGWTPHAKATD